MRLITDSHREKRPGSENARPVVVERALRDGVLAVGITLLSAPASIAVAAIVGHVSIKALGYYAMLNLVLAGVTAVGSGGGAWALSQFRGVGGEQQAGIALGQVLTALVVSGLGSLTLVLFGVQGAVPGWLFCLLAVSASVWACAQGWFTVTLRFWAASAIQNWPTLFQLPFVIAAALFYRPYFRAHAAELLALSYVIPLATIGVAYLAMMLRRGLSTMRGGADGRLARVILRSTGVLCLGVLFDNGERLAVFHARDGLIALGLYTAAFQAAMVVRRIPALLGQASLAGFTNLSEAPLIENLRRRASHGAEVVAVVAAFGLSMFADRWVQLYGNDFRRAAIAVILVSLGYAGTAGAAVDGSETTARGDLRNYGSSLTAGLTAFLPVVLMPSVIWMGAARAAAVTILQVGLVLRARGVRGRRIRQLVATWGCGGAALLAQHLLGGGVVTSLVILVAAIAVYLGAMSNRASTRVALPRTA